MRRLSRMAQSTLLSVKETLGLDERGEGLPPSPSPRSTRELPEWKFFNKVNSFLFLLASFPELKKHYMYDAV